jgi:hypothetical protein
MRSSGIFDGVKVRTVIHHAWKPNVASELDRQFSDSCTVHVMLQNCTDRFGLGVTS